MALQVTVARESRRSSTSVSGKSCGSFCGRCSEVDTVTLSAAADPSHTAWEELVGGLIAKKDLVG